jgi:hypothetical protein
MWKLEVARSIRADQKLRQAEESACPPVERADCHEAKPLQGFTPEAAELAAQIDRLEGDLREMVLQMFWQILDLKRT